MGAGQSSTSAAQEGAPEGQKTSYYTLLGIERTATEEEIKKAYRRKALELHPDRNYGNVEAATALFAEIQSAHEVLSDPQERAWYDAHEAQILRGDDPSTAGAGAGGAEYGYGNVNMTSTEDLARLLRKFNSRVEFSDAPSGFFGFVRETFEQLAREEEAAADWEGADLPDYPSFGHKDDEYDDVPRAFYAVWLSFGTRKSFAWCDKYRLSEAPDRRYRRLMEKENQRLRDQAARDFNDAVRALVAFVRKRDPRYIPNTQSEAERQKVLRDAAQAQAARARAANQVSVEEFAIPEWATTIERDEHEGVIGESEDEEEQVYECVACKKVFKSENQWEAHEKSKKHQKAVAALRKKMQKDNANLDLGGDATPLDDDSLAEEEYPIIDDDDGDVADDVTNLTIDSDSSHGDQATAETTDDDDQGNDDNDDHEDEKSEAKAPSLDRPPENLGLDSSSDHETLSVSQQPAKGKAAQKRAKKAAAAAAASAAEEANSFKCATCEATFPSKTRLHQHIKDFKHAALKSVTSAGAAKKKKGKR